MRYLIGLALVVSLCPNVIYAESGSTLSNPDAIPCERRIVDGIDCVVCEKQGTAAVTCNWLAVNADHARTLSLKERLSQAQEGSAKKNAPPMKFKMVDER